jgi:hypothetical protein
VTTPKVWTIDDYEVNGRREVTLRDEHYEVTLEIDRDGNLVVEHEVDSDNYGGGMRTVRCYVPMVEVDRWLAMVRPAPSTAPRADPFGMGLAPSDLSSRALTATEVQKRVDEIAAPAPRQPSEPATHTGCPRCSGSYAIDKAGDGRPRFTCDACGYVWTAGGDGGKYAAPRCEACGFTTSDAFVWEAHKAWHRGEDTNGGTDR